jgi:hypothetical protein
MIKYWHYDTLLALPAVKNPCTLLIGRRVGPTACLPNLNNRKTSCPFHGRTTDLPRRNQSLYRTRDPGNKSHLQHCVWLRLSGLLKAPLSWDITRLYQRSGCITLFRNVCLLLVVTAPHTRRLKYPSSPVWLPECGKSQNYMVTTFR